METEEPEPVDIDAVLATLRTPSIPDEAFHSDNVDLYQITTWKKESAIAVLAGLATSPEFHANGIRLDWLQRLIFSKAEGEHEPDSEALSRALNGGLDRPGVLRLEDPIEDLFCDLIATERGCYRIITGQWEAAAPYTQTLLDAFKSLPTGKLKQDTLESVHSLLALSDMVAARANVDRLTASGGDPKGLMAVPQTAALGELGKRVRFTDAELKQMGINRDALSPFFLKPEHFVYISDRQAGDTPLEFHPLLAGLNEIIVASPCNISLAVRAIIVLSAQTGGMENVLLHALHVRQQEYSEVSGFWPVSPLRACLETRRRALKF